MLRSVAEFSIPSALAKSDFVVTVDDDLCAGCGECLARCQFEALALPDDLILIDQGRCVGCGLCVPVCPTGALRLERRSEGEIPPPPDNFDDWLAQRAWARDLA